MKTKKAKFIIISLILCTYTPLSYAHSARHHLIKATKGIIGAAFSPLYGILIQGPKNIKEAYTYEVYQREKPEKRGQLRYKLFGIWRAPGEEVKGIIDGISDTVTHSTTSLKELVSILFSD